MLHRLFLSCLFLQSLFAFDEISYTQNNLPRQGEMSSMLSKTAILINGDITYGRIVSDQAMFAQLTNDDGSNIAQKNLRYRTQDRVGFRVGLGASLGHNSSNISLQYSWLRNRKTDKRNVSSQYVITFNASGFVPVLPQMDTLLTSKTFIRMQTLDLVVQTAKYMMSEKTRMQPLIGLRYLPFDRRTEAIAIQQDQQVARAFEKYKLWGTGPFIGSDVKFIATEDIHFFGSCIVGLLAGNRNTFVIGTDLRGGQQSNTDFKFLFNPFLELRFGLAYSQLIQGSWLFSLRIAYEMFSMIQNDALIFTPADSEFSPPFAVIKKQAGMLGFTLVF